MACFVRWGRVCSPNARCWRRWRVAARLAGKCARIAKFHHTIPHPYSQNLAQCPSMRVRVLVLFTWEACANLVSPCPHSLLARCAGIYRQSCGKASRSSCILTGPLSSCGCPRSNFELLSITACLGDYLNSISVVENYMEHSIISEPGLLISDNASGISGMTPLSDAIERMSGTIRYRTVFFPYGRDMLNRVKVNARVSYFPPPAFRESFRVFGWILRVPESV